MIFGLYRAGMNSLMVKGDTNIGGDQHEVVFARGSNMHGCHDFSFGELPDVQFMERKHAVDG